MWFKKKEAILGSILLIIMFSFYSCINEPTVEPVKRPFSTIRVFNLSPNVDPISVTINGSQPTSALNSIGLTHKTEYFNVPSGKDTFIVKDNAGNEVYNNTVELQSYERSTIFFAGNFTNDINTNNFGAFQVDEAEVYASLAPEQGKLSILFIHASASKDTIQGTSYGIETYITIPPDTAVIDTIWLTRNPSPLGFGAVFSVANVLPGSYAFDLVPVDTSRAVVSTPTFNLTAGHRYYLFLYGDPNNVQFLNDEEVPPPVSSRN